MEIFLSFIGGLLIAIASSANFLLSGKITGFSGLFWSLVSFQKGQLLWKIAFISMFILTGSLITILKDIEKSPLLVDIVPSASDMTKGLSFIGFCISGFLVGFGTKLGSGCTSGHGVCGLPRFSKRSWVAVGVFFSTAMAIANIRHHYPFLEDTYSYSPSITVQHSEKIFAIVSGLIIIIVIIYSKNNKNDVNMDQILVALFSGCTFSLGLILSGMIKKDRILNFLVISNTWDCSLAIVLGTTVIFNIISFNRVNMEISKPLFSDRFDIPQTKFIDFELILGAIIFGLGWGISGICPGPAILLIHRSIPHVTIGFIGCMSLGNVAAHLLEKFFYRQHTYTIIE